MSAAEEPLQADWLTMAEAMAAFKLAGKLPEEAAALLHRHLAAGTLLAKADTIRMEYYDGGETTHSEWEVPAALWGYCPLPPLGHRFWIVGDVRFQPPPDMDELSLDPVLPTVIILGAKVSRDGLSAITRAIGGAKGRGRRRGAGSLAESDEPLVLEMHALVKSRRVPSLYQAALDLAKRAKGGGTEESKAKRLIARYGERYPNL
jgi:hypothetical protein